MSSYWPALLTAATVMTAAAGSPGVGAAAPTTSPASTDPVADAAPPLDALIAEALARSPALGAARARVAARREMEGPAAALPDPMAEAMLQNAGTRWTVGDEEMSMIGGELRQGLPYPGKRAAARRVAEAETAEAAAALATLESEVTREVSVLYARLYAMDRERETLAAATELVDLLGATARSRYATGQAEQEAVLKAQLQAVRLDEELADLATRRHGMVTELNRWLDRAGDAALGAVAALPAAPAPGDDAAVRAAAEAPEALAARAAVDTAEGRVAIARLELRPNFSVGAGAGYRGSMDPVITARFGVEIPLWRRQKQLPMLRAAEQELEMARRELADAESMARAAGARLLAEWRNADEQVRRYRDGILPQADAAFDAARAAYLAGRGDFSTLVEDFDLWLEARVGLAQREADRFAATAAYRRLTGAPAPAPPGPPATRSEP